MNLLIILLIIIIILFFLNLILLKDRYSSLNNYSLKDDGVIIVNNVLSEDEINYLKNLSNNDDYKIVKRNIMNNKNIQKIIYDKLGDGYQFHDYIFIIKKSAIHTCHRDANGDFFNNIKNPSYTMIIYLDDMEKCLGVIPKSHTNLSSFGINTKNEVINVMCKKGDILLFNANTIHVGTINNIPNNLRIQMKVSHKDDISNLTYYTNYNKILKEDNNIPDSLKKISQNISCMFPFVSNLTQNDIKKSGSIKSSNDLSFSEKMFSYIFYGKSDYYNLPNAF